MRFFLILLIFFEFSSLSWGQHEGRGVGEHKPVGHSQPAKNVILFLGGGMGLTQISAAMYQDTQRLSLESFPVTGLQKAYASDRVASDLAASSTAIASGKKVDAGVLTAITRKRSVRTLLQHAETRGMATGLIVNSDLTGPPAAAFLGLSSSAESKEKIAEVYLDRDLDLIIGGGRASFTARLEDSRNLALELEEKGYQVTDFQHTAFPKVTLDLKKNAAHFLADGIDSSFQQFPERYLSILGLALNYLPKHNSGGFFLVIGLDVATSQSTSIAEQIELVKACDHLIGHLYDFARQDGKTLLVATSTGEENGWAINPGSQRGVLLMESASAGPTGIMLPVFAFGPGARLFSGVYDNTEIHQKISQALGWE